MVLSALVFGRQLRREQVTCQSITGITREQARQATSQGDGSGTSRPWRSPAQAAQEP